MAKQNRRINIRRRTLQERCAFLEDIAHAHIAQISGLNSALGGEKQTASQLRSELAEVTRLLRAYCQHTFVLPPIGSVPSDKAFCEAPEKKPGRYRVGYGRALDRLGPIELVGFIVAHNDENGREDFRRIVHFKMKKADGTINFAAVALSRETLEFFQREPGMAENYLANQFAPAFSEAGRAR